MTNREANSIKHYKAAMQYWLDCNDIKRVNRHLIEDGSYPWNDRNRKLQAWLRDSILWSLEELESDRNIYVFRGLLQAAGYATEVGNDSITSDAIIFLRNAMEDRIMATGSGDTL